MTRKLMTLLCFLMSLTFTAVAQSEKGAAELETAAKLYEGEKYSQALLWYKRSANKGNTEAMEMLVEMYIEGLGGPVDLKAAKLWQDRLDKADAKAERDDTAEEKDPKRKKRSTKDEDDEDKLPYNKNEEPD